MLRHSKGDMVENNNELYEFLIKSGMTSEKALTTTNQLNDLCERDNESNKVRAEKALKNMDLTHSGLKKDNDVLNVILIGLMTNGLYDALKFSIVFMSNQFMSADDPAKGKEDDPIAPWNIYANEKEKMPPEAAFNLSYYCRDVQLAFQDYLHEKLLGYFDENISNSKLHSLFIVHQIEASMKRESEEDALLKQVSKF